MFILVSFLFHRVVQADPALDLETLRKLGPLTVVSNHERLPGYGEGGPSWNYHVASPQPSPTGPAPLWVGPQVGQHCPATPSPSRTVSLAFSDLSLHLSAETSSAHPGPVTTHILAISGHNEPSCPLSPALLPCFLTSSRPQALCPPSF